MDFDPNQINAFMNFLPNEAKKNLFNPTTEVIGKGLAGILYFVFQKPLEFGIVEKKHLNDLCKMASEELVKIPKKNRDRKGMNLAFKAVEESKYSLNDDELRKWFAKLIVTSLDNRKNSSLTPYYSTILSNINGITAKFLLNFYDPDKPLPLCKITKKAFNGFVTLKDSIVYWNWTDKSDPVIEPIKTSIIEVLSSFNIINVDYNSSLSSDKAQIAYKEFKKSIVYKNEAKINAVTAHKVNPNSIDENNIPFEDEICIKEGVLSLTKFGKSFIKATMPTNKASMPIHQKESKVRFLNL